MDDKRDSRGFAIAPYKIEIISGLANKIVKLLLTQRLTLNLAEMNIALSIAEITLNAEEGDEQIE